MTIYNATDAQIDNLIAWGKACGCKVESVRTSYCAPHVSIDVGEITVSELIELGRCLTLANVSVGWEAEDALPPD